MWTFFKKLFSKPKKKLDSIKDTQILGIFLLILIIFGLFFRFHSLGEQSIWLDEAFSTYAGKMVSTKGSPILETGRFYDNHLIYSYISGLNIKLFGLDTFNPWVLRLPSVFFGTLTIWLIFIFALRLFKRKDLALLTAFVITFSYLEVAWSRQIRGYSLSQFLILISSLNLYLFLTKEKIKNVFLFSVFYLLAVINHLANIIFLPAFIFCLFIWRFVFEDKIKKKDWLLLIFTIPFIVYIFHRNIETYNALGYYSDYLFNNLTLVTIISIFSFIFIILDKSKFKPSLFVFINTLLPFLTLSTFSPVANNRYLMMILPFMLILNIYSISFIINKLFDWIRKSKDESVRYVEVFKISILSITVLAVFWPHLIFKPQTYFYLGEDSPQPDFKSAYEFIGNKSEQYNDLTFFTPYPHVNELYTGQTGYWIPFSLSNDPNELNWTKIDNKERFTGAEAIKTDYNYLENILKHNKSNQNESDNNKSIIIFDHLSVSRMPVLFRNIFKSNDFKLIFNKKDPNGEIWVFENI